MSLFSKLFGSGASSGPEPEVYGAYRIFPEPAKASGGHRIGARIEKEIDGDVKTHLMIRADTCMSAEEAVDVSILKAKMLIDQQGDAIFG